MTGELPALAVPRDVHVAPLPAGHREDRLCPCVPIESARIGQATLLVHRIDGGPGILPEYVASREGS